MVSLLAAFPVGGIGLLTLGWFAKKGGNNEMSNWSQSERWSRCQANANLELVAFEWPITYALDQIFV